MKKFKFVMPLLAFVVAITVAFAVPTEVETSSEAEAFVSAFYPSSHPTNGCQDCGIAVGTDCIVDGAGDPCTCSADTDFDAHTANASCELLKERN